MANVRELTREELAKVNEQLQEMVRRLQTENDMLREVIVRINLEKYNVR